MADMVASTGIPNQRTWASFFPSNLSHQSRLGSIKNLLTVPDTVTDPKKTNEENYLPLFFLDQSIYGYINSLSFKQPKLPVVLKGIEKKVSLHAMAQNYSRMLN